jgi:hypothetical protein
MAKTTIMACTMHPSSEKKGHGKSPMVNPPCVFFTYKFTGKPGVTINGKFIDVKKIHYW